MTDDGRRRIRRGDGARGRRGESQVLPGMTLFAIALLLIAPHAAKPGRFLEVRGTRLLLAGRPYRNVGANLPDLFERFLHGQDLAAERSLADAEAPGIRFVRCFGSTWGPADFHLFLDDRQRWLGAYDRMLAAAQHPSLRLSHGLAKGQLRAVRGDAPVL